MGSGPSIDTSNKEIVIVGGGYSGGYLAHLLVSQNVGKVKLIEPLDGVFHSIGALRAVVDESYGKKLFVPYTAKLEKCHIKSKATGLDSKNKTVTLENGETVKYTDLIIATGTSSPFPGKLGKENTIFSKEATLERYSELRKELIASKRVVLVGGGAVGVELAGEIKTEFPDKEVTIVNSRDVLVSSALKPAFQNAVKKALSKKKIEVLEKDRVSNMDELTFGKNINDQVVKTEGGKEISCDLVIACTGYKLNNQFFKEDLADAVNEVGALCVDEYLRVKGHDNIYAIGDITDVKEEKMAYSAKLHAEGVVKTLKGNSTAYKTNFFGMVVPIGRNGGVGQVKGMIVGDFVTKTLKSKDLFAGQMFSDMGVKIPH